MTELPLHIVVVEDDPAVRSGLLIILNGHKTAVYPDSRSLAESCESKEIKPLAWDLILLDLCSESDPQGTQTIARIPLLKAAFANASVVVQSGVEDIELMRACVKAGATQFVAKDHLQTELPALLERISEERTSAAALKDKLCGQSEVVQRLRREILDLRTRPWDVLIEGETGAGKEVCAQALHGGGPWVAVNASAIPADLFEAEFFGAEKGAFTGAHQTRLGHFEAAAGGTLFIDEIQSLSLSHQAKLLRVLETRLFQRVGSSQERPLRARIVAASNGDLKGASEKGSFREDLYYRLSALTLRVPPLRVRSGDVAFLARKFLAEQASSKEFTSDALKFLETYDWPGNVRQLRNFVRSAAMRVSIPKIGELEAKDILSADEKTLFEMPGTVPKAEGGFSVSWDESLDENVARFEKHYISGMLTKHPGNAAREKMKLARSRFYEKLKVYGLKNN